MNTEPRTVHLEVNDAGGWRSVSSFNLADFNDGDLELCAEHLLQLSNNPRIKARIIMPADTAPLVTWTRQEGWHEWVHPGSRRAQGELA
jgi:hypothetical protein